MAQHFLISAASHTLNLREIYAAGEEKNYETFCRLRWEQTGGQPHCPACGSLDHYKISTRRRFKCADCYRQYSATSGTLFASRKLSFTDLLAGMCLFANAVKGVSALQFARDMGINAKSAFVWLHKIREAVAAETKNAKLFGEVEIDGAHVGGRVRPANLAIHRVDRRRSDNQSDQRRVVIALRQRGGRTLPFVALREAHGVQIASRFVERGSKLFADEAPGWDALHATFETARINHSIAYSLNGIHTNFVESYFSRLRRMIEGQHHHVSARHLNRYASEAAWKEDHRQLSNGALAHRALGLVLTNSPSKFFAGYWHR
jgi:transposase-like protein